MASSKEYLLYVLDNLSKIEGITYKKMMGEFLLYKDNILFGGVYDNRFLLKRTKVTMSLQEATPYPGGKAMSLVDIEDKEEIARLVLSLLDDLKG